MRLLLDKKKEKNELRALFEALKKKNYISLPDVSSLP